MFCPKCGKRLPNNAAFCNSCGRRFETSEKAQNRDENPTYDSKPEHKKGVKLRIVLLLISIILILIAGAGGYLFYQYYTSPEQVILRDLASGNYTEAVRIYNRNYDEDNMVSNDVLDTITKVLDENYNAFVNNENPYSTVYNDIDSIAKMNIADLEDKISDIQAAIDALNDSRTAFETANQYMSDEKYREAIQEYQKVIADDSNYAAAQENLEMSTEAYRTSILEDAKAKADSGNLSGAVTVLEAGLKVLDNDSQLTQQITQYQSQISESTRQIALDESKSYADSGNYKSALQTLKTALSSYPDDSELQIQYDKYETAYVNDVIAVTNECIQNNDYDSAIAKLTEGTSSLKNNQTLSDKLQKVQDEKPVNLSEIKMSNSKEMVLEELAMEDVVGNIYSGNNLFSLNYHNSINNYREFYLGGKYYNISGIIVPESRFGENSAVNIEIYVDDTLKYSLKITQKTLATSFDVDISGAQWIKIVASEIDGEYAWSTQTLFYNPVLKKSD